jgi:hypothetical protein
MWFSQIVEDAARAVTVSLDVDAGAAASVLALAGATENNTSVFYLRKLAPGAGVRIADATASHIAFTPGAGTWYLDSKGGSGRNANQTRISLEPVKTLALAQLNIDTAIAIT